MASQGVVTADPSLGSRCGAGAMRGFWSVSENVPLFGMRSRMLIQTYVCDGQGVCGAVGPVCHVEVFEI